MTLGGLVHHCFIDGKVFKDPGDLDGQALIIVPITVLAPEEPADHRRNHRLACRGHAFRAHIEIGEAVDQWWVAGICNSPVSRATEAFNDLISVLPHLIEKLV